jgi:hypothetical protein
MGRNDTVGQTKSTEETRESKESTRGDKALKRLTVEFSTGIIQVIVRKEAYTR